MHKLRTWRLRKVKWLAQICTVHRHLWICLRSTLPRITSLSQFHVFLLLIRKHKGRLSSSVFQGSRMVGTPTQIPNSIVLPEEQHVVQALSSSTRPGHTMGKVVGIVAGSHLLLCTQPRRWLLPQEGSSYIQEVSAWDLASEISFIHKADGDIHVKGIQSWGKICREWRFKNFPGVDGTRKAWHYRPKFMTITPA